MTPFPNSTIPFSAPVLVCALAALSAAGCAAPTPRVDAESAISGSLAIPEAVVFRTEGDPVDAAAGADDVLRSGEAIRRAVETSPELQAALARVRAAQAEADLAGLLPDPVLSFVLRFPEGGGDPEIEGSLAADLLAILQRPRRSSAAGHRLEAEAASALATALDVVAETRDLYASAQVLEQLVPLLEERLAVLDRLREVAQARLELGEGTRNDVTTLESERSELGVQAAQRRQELRRARIALARRVGEPSGAAAWRLDAWQGPPDVPTDEAAWIETALRARPEVQALRWEVRARGDDAAIAGSAAFSGLAVGLDAERTNHDSLGPSLSAPVPVFDRGSERKRRADALLAEARHRLVEAQRAVVEEVRASLATLSGSRENLDRVVRELVPLQERRRSEVEATYRLGHADVTALLLAEQALQETTALRIGLEREVSAALVRLERSVGGRAVLEGSQP